MRLNPTWYDYQLQLYRDVPSHLANEDPVSAKNRHSPSSHCSPPSSLLGPPTHLSMNHDVPVRFRVHALPEDVPSILSILRTIGG